MSAEFIPTSRPPVSDALVSIVLPVHDELTVLVELCQRLRMTLTACRTTFEIIFVDDGSRDGSAALLDRLARQFEEVRIVHLSRNFGQQAAIHAGLERACGDAVVIMDANLRDPPEALAELLDAWQEGYDVVYATRVRRGQSHWKRALWSAVHRLASNTEAGVPEYVGNFGLIDARLAQLIAGLGEQDRYLPALRNWVGFKQIGIPVDRAGRRDKGMKRSLRGLARCTKTAIYSAAPPAMFTWLGWIALAVFMYLSGFGAYCKVFSDAAVPSWALQVILVSFFVGLNALGIGMLGHYLVRIYDQVRARPLYVVDRTVNFAAAAIGEAQSSDERLNCTGQSDGMKLEQLDPLEIDDDWDDAYQHLLDHAQDLMELGALARSEADDLADRESRQSTSTADMSDIETSVAPAPADADEPQVIKLSDPKLRQ